MKDKLYNYLSGLLLIPFFCFNSFANPEINQKLPYKIQWLSPEVALKQSKESGKTTMISFCADWCERCKELEHNISNDNDVINELSGFVLVKNDVTEITPMVKKLFEKYEIEELPVIVFIDKNGKTLSQYTVRGIKSSKDFLNILKKVNKEVN